MIIALGATPALQRSMTFDRFQLDAVNRTSNVVEYASGKSINAARVLKTLQSPVIATGLLGADTGGLVREDLDRAAIRHDFHEVSARTRMCITLIDRLSAQATELVEESKPVDSDDWTALQAKLQDLLGDASMLMLLGSLPPGAPQDFYARCTRLACERGVRTILDAKGPPLHLALNEKPFLVKPNRRELEETVGSTIHSDDHLREAIKNLLSRGPEWAVVTAGAGDVVISNGADFWKITPPAVSAISPIGSGDSLAAGIAAKIIGGTGVPEATVFGVACAVANCLTPLAGHIRLDDLHRVSASVKITDFQ